MWPSNGVGFEAWSGGQANCINDIGIVAGHKSSGGGGWLYVNGADFQATGLLDSEVAPFAVHDIIGINNLGRAITHIYNPDGSQPDRWSVIDFRSRSRPTTQVNTVQAGDAVTLESVVSGLPATDMSWRKHGSILRDGVTPWGSTVSGAQTPNLTIASIQPQDSGAYAYVGSNLLGETAAELAFVNVLTVTTDLTTDSVVNAADLAQLLGAWSLPPGTPGCAGARPCAADINADGQVNAADLAILLGAWTV